MSVETRLQADQVLGSTERQAARWDAILSLSLSVIGFIMSEMLPASLLTPMASDLGITEGTAGQAVTVTSFVALFTSLFTAPATRRLDRRAVLLTLAGLLVLSNLFVGFASNYVMLLVGRVLLGLGLGGFWSMASAVTIRLVPRELGPKALSVVYGSVSIGMLAAVPVGTYLGSAIGWRGVFLGTGAIALVALAWQFFVLPSMPPGGQSSLGTLVALLRRPQIRAGLLGMVLVFGGHFTFFTYLRPFLERVTGLDVGGITTLLVGFGIANLIGAAFSGAMVKSNLHRTQAAMPILMILIIVGMVLYGQSLAVSALGVAAWGFAWGVIPVSWATWITRAAPDETESAGGLQVAVIQAAITVGAGFGGALLDTFGPASPFLGAGAAAVAAIVLVFAWLKPIAA